MNTDNIKMKELVFVAVVPNVRLAPQNKDFENDSLVMPRKHVWLLSVKRSS